MRHQVQVQLRKHGVFQRVSQLDFEVHAKTLSRARRAALKEFAGKRGQVYHALSCGLGQGGTLHMLVIPKAEADAQEQVRLEQIRGQAAQPPKPLPPVKGLTGRKRR